MGDGILFADSVEATRIRERLIALLVLVVASRRVASTFRYEPRTHIALLVAHGGFSWSLAPLPQANGVVLAGPAVDQVR